MKDYKIIQYQNLKLKDYNDDLSVLTFKVIEMNDSELISEITSYFFTDKEILVFPAKSYAVAIIYSLLIEKYFSTPFYDSLSDENLFWNSDKYFVSYQHAKHIYDKVLITLKKDRHFDVENIPLENVKKTIEFFKQEFGLDQNAEDHL